MRKGGRADVLVVGAGIFGLCCAWSCADRGLRVVVADRDRPGAGASGGPVGALAPHAPDRWSARLAFQRDALLAAEAHWSRVAAASGRDPGYARIGRVVPLRSAADLDRARASAGAAARNWGRAGTWSVVAADAFPGWLAPGAAPFGAVHETLSARIHPRAACGALAAALAARGVEIRAGIEARAVGPGAVEFAGARLTARVVIVAAGADSARLVGLDPCMTTGVKGQALLARLRRPAAGPLVSGGGLFVVPHADGTVGVGSTSDTEWHDAHATDARLDAVWARARAACPALADAEVTARWAGLRPRAPRPDPMLGPVPGRDGVLVATGGFRIGLGLAPAVGELLADMAAGRAVALPDGCAVADHLRAARPGRGEA